MDTRILKNGWKNFKRNSYLSVGTIGVMTMSLVLCMGLLGMQFLTSEIVVSLRDKVDISVYFKTDAAEDQINKVKSDLSKLSEVETVAYISRDQALEEFKKRHAGDVLIEESLAQLEDNPLSASLNIKAHETSQYAAIAQQIEKSSFRSLIDKINFYENKDVIQRIEQLSSSINTWVLLSTIILASIAILVTFNTIRLTIYNQKREIEIMRLVGASNKQIRGPFLAEGAFYGLFSAFISMVLFYPIVYFASDRINAFTSVNVFSYFLHGLPQVGLLVIGLGVFLGIVSSSVAIRKYLNI